MMITNRNFFFGLLFRVFIPRKLRSHEMVSCSSCRNSLFFCPSQCIAGISLFSPGSGEDFSRISHHYCNFLSNILRNLGSRILLELFLNKFSRKYFQQSVGLVASFKHISCLEDGQLYFRNGSTYI